MNTGHIDWSPDYKSRGGDPLRFDMKAPPDPLLALVRELRDALVNSTGKCQICKATPAEGQTHESGCLVARADAALAEPRPGESAGEKEGA